MSAFAPANAGVLDNVDLLRRVLELLEARFGAAAADRADISVAGDMAQVLEMLSAAPNALRLILADEGDAPANEDQPETGVVRQTFSVFVAMPAGLPSKAKAGAWLGKHGAPALLVRCNEVRDFLRSLAFPPELTGERLEYTGRQPVLDADNSPLHAYRLGFQIYFALPDPDTQLVSI